MPYTAIPGSSRNDGISYMGEFFMMEKRFIRAAALLGKEAMQQLSACHVAVFGLGGVGSWCAEGLARSGIGRLTLIDRDIVSESNINRQLIALSSTVGRPKAEVMAERISDINPACRVTALTGTYDAEHREDFFSDYDFVADAIDLVSCKLDLICTCLERNIPIISALGTGNKLDPSLLRISDISKTENDALARVVRKELRSRGIHHTTVVWSPELPIEAEQLEAPDPGRRSVPGSLVWVPSSAGLMMCSHIVTALAEKVKN